VTGTETASVFEQCDAEHYEHIAEVPAGYRAKSSIFVPERKRLYVAASGQGEPDAKLELQIYEVQCAEHVQGTTLSAMPGLTSTTMTMRYLHPAAEQKKLAAAKRESVLDQRLAGGRWRTAGNSKMGVDPGDLYAGQADRNLIGQAIDQAMQRGLIPGKQIDSRPREKVQDSFQPGADTFLTWSAWPFLAPTQPAKARMNTGSEALLIGNALKKFGQLLTLALRQHRTE
jgi:hypothetical protein